MSKRTALIVLSGLILANFALWAQSSAHARRKTGYPQLDLIVDTYHEVLDLYVDEQDPDKVAEAAVRGMLRSLEDPYTVYYSKKDMQEFNKNIRGTFSGIGAEVDIDKDYLRIISPLEDSPAWNAGILAGDIVLEVEGKSTKGLNINECVRRLVGPVGTKVTIKVRHKTGKEETITITRAKINVQTVRGWRRNAKNRCARNYVIRGCTS